MLGGGQLDFKGYKLSMLNNNDQSAGGDEDSSVPVKVCDCIFMGDGIIAQVGRRAGRTSSG